MKFIRDLKANRKNYKGLTFLLFFRISNFLFRYRKTVILFIVGIPIWIFYKVFFEWIMSIDISYKTEIGAGLCFEHCMGTVLNQHVVMGENCHLRHNTTIGCKKCKADDPDCPVIGNNVKIGSNSIILGNISIGNNVIIGAGSVVLKDIPANSLVAGNPASVIRIISGNE